MRLAACLGVPLEVIEPCGFALSDRAVRRAAMDYGGIGGVTRRRSWTDFLAAPERAQGRLVLFTTEAASPLHDFAFRPGDSLLFGRESAGAPPEVHAAADARLIIPLVPGARSLNVVTAAAIALGEALRRTGGFPNPDPS